MGNKQSVGDGEGATPNSLGGPAKSKNSTSRLPGEEDAEDPVFDVPPPMQPIASVPLSATGDEKRDASADALAARLAGGASASDNNGPCDPNAAGDPTPDVVKAESDPEVVAKTIEQRHFRLQELVESEQTYVQDLEQCVEYIKFMRESKEAEDPEVPMPEDLREGKDRMVFGNIEAIFEWHRE